MRYPLIHFQTDPGGGSGGSGGDGGSGSQADPNANPDPGGQGSGSGSGNSNTEMVPATEAQEARREAKNLRDRLKAAEKERDDLKTAQMSDADKLIKERDEAVGKVPALEAKLRNLQVQVLATKVGVVDPEAAAALLNWDNIDDPEDPKKVERALRDLVKDKPYLAGNTAGGSDGGAGSGNGASTDDMNSLIRQGFGRTRV